MSDIVDFKKEYWAGETATLAIVDAEATAITAVVGKSSYTLTKGDNDRWTLEADTASLVGRVTYTVFATYGERKVAIAHGSFRVKCAGRSPLRDVVDAIDEAIKTWGTNPNRSIQVGEIAITYKSLDELMAIRAHYLRQAEEQEAGRSLTGGLRVVEVDFNA